MRCKIQHQIVRRKNRYWFVYRNVPDMLSTKTGQSVLIVGFSYHDSCLHVGATTVRQGHAELAQFLMQKPALVLPQRPVDVYHTCEQDILVNYL